MQKIIRLLPVLFLFNIQLSAQNRLLNQPMIIKNCSVNIKVNCIHATTDIELEFYNDRDVEIEGLLNFTLKPQQAITDFQLDLNGTYRKGSIEEKWKANNAYNTIVGKRVDPALLQMQGIGTYTLNVYPVPAKSSRKVKLTIEEVMPLKDEYYHYALEMFKQLTLQQVSIHIETGNNPYGPVAPSGLISRTTFNKSFNAYILHDQYNQPVSGGTVVFKIPAPEQKEIAFRDAANGTFMARIQDTIPETITRSLKRIRVYWDRSGSMQDNQTEYFLKFLNVQVKRYNAESVQIIPFNHKPGEGKTFTGNELNPWYWRKFINKIPFYGGTNFGALNLSTSDDIIFVFTDGKHTWGSRAAQMNQAPVLYVTVPFNDPVYNNKTYAADYYSAYNYSYYNRYYDGDIYNALNYYYPTTIRLNTSDTAYRYPQFTQRRIEMISATDENGRPLKLPENIKLNGQRYVTGELPSGSRSVILNFGYGDKILYTKKIDIGNYCSQELNKRITTLLNFEIITGTPNNWYRSLGFGIDNRIVCWQTAFIVLERIEDYVKYNITPPEEIMQECLDKGFVKKDYKQQYFYMQRMGASVALQQVANYYNQRLSMLGNTNDQIKIADIAGSFSRIEEDKKVANKEMAFAGDYKSGAFDMAGGNLEEVVVTGYATAKRKDMMSYSTTKVTANQLNYYATPLSEALQGKVAGVQVISRPGTGDIAQIRIRGISSLSGNNQPLFVLNGVPMEFDHINNLSTSEIDNITILKDAASTAIYGSRGANGVIVVETKKGRQNGYSNVNQQTRLKNAEDEDYITEIKETATDDKYSRYLQLRHDNKTNMAFFIDMAMHFSDVGLSEYVDEMLMEAAEISNNDYGSLMASAFAYEHMRNYKKAVEIYSDLAKSYPYQLGLQHSIAWAYYENGQRDSAVQLLYRTIIGDDYYSNYDPNMKLKGIMLADMNMIIALHPDEVNTRFIPKEIIKPVSSELRVLVETNGNSLYTLYAQEGNKEKIDYSKPTQKDNRLILAGYNSSTAEFEAQELSGKTIRLYDQHYDYWYNRQVPPMVRIRSIYNFGKPDQRIQTEIISLKNQFGQVEIADYRHKDLGKR